MRPVLVRSSLPVILRFGNLVTLTAPRNISVSIEDPSRPSYAGPQLPKLDPVNSIQLSMPESAATAVGPFLVAMNTGSKFGNYCLMLQVADVPNPLQMEFTFTDASKWSDDCIDAQHQKEEADRLLSSCIQNRASQQKRVCELDSQIAQKLAAAQTASHQPNASNWQDIQQDCLTRRQQLPMPRAARLRSGLVNPTQKQALHQIPGVLGFACDLLGVTDEPDAKLLSWYAQFDLSTLVVATWDAKLAVEDLWTQQWHKGQQLTILPLDQVSTSPDVLGRALPHRGTCILQ